MFNFTKRIFILFFILFFSNIFIEIAKGENVNVNENNTSEYVQLREPFLENEKKIDVSRERGSIGILSEYVSMIFTYVMALSGIIAVLVIMFSGFQLMVSGGDSEARSTAKQMITKTLMGIAMLFLSGLFLYTINPNFYMFGGDSDTGNSIGKDKQ
jgi:hypothetical protein